MLPNIFFHHHIFNKLIRLDFLHRNSALCFYSETYSKHFRCLKATDLECFSSKNEDQCVPYQTQDLDNLAEDSVTDHTRLCQEKDVFLLLLHAGLLLGFLAFRSKLVFPYSKSKVL
jgi:hypothetical protein